MKLLLLLLLAGWRVEAVGLSGCLDIQVGRPAFHVEAEAFLRPAVIRWHCWKGDDGASFGTAHADGSIIAYGYWPDCRHNSTPRWATPSPFCGCRQAPPPY